MKRFAKLSMILSAVVCAATVVGCATDSEADAAPESEQPSLAREVNPPGPRGFDDGDYDRRTRDQGYWGPTFIYVQPPPGARNFRDFEKVLDVSDWQTGNRDDVVLWTAKKSRNQDNRNQLWRIHPRGDAFVFQNEYSGKCLDETRDFGRRNGNQVYQYECNGSPNQHWEFLGRRGEWGALRNKWSGRCLDVSNFEFRDGAALQTWDCSGNWNQQWSIW